MIPFQSVPPHPKHHPPPKKKQKRLPAKGSPPPNHHPKPLAFRGPSTAAHQPREAIGICHLRADVAVHQGPRASLEPRKFFLGPHHPFPPPRRKKKKLQGKRCESYHRCRAKCNMRCFKLLESVFFSPEKRSSSSAGWWFGGLVQTVDKLTMFPQADMGKLGACPLVLVIEVPC